MQIRLYNPSDRSAWDSYVYNHPNSTHCHLSGWKNVIENTYGHKGYYFLAEENSSIIGILPLVYIKNLLSVKQLVSMPFLNYGGILVDSPEVADAIIEEAVQLSLSLKSSSIELRHINPMDGSYLGFVPKTHKVRMLLELPGSGEALFNNFKSKLRSQIRRSQKEGMKAIIGGRKLLDQFYKVFSINMRDLGSPVHSKNLFRHILSDFDQNVKIGVVQYHDKPVSAGLIFYFRDTVEIPWASSLRKYNRLSPNMLLYWSFLEYACNHSFRYFDFGRSTSGGGTYKFKEQWGAKPYPLYWYMVGHSKYENVNPQSESVTFKLAASVWQRLPVFMANVLGPMFRRLISL
jgi:FemAB-related protein (PEP-CTERM system-associated)